MKKIIFIFLVMCSFSVKSQTNTLTFEKLNIHLIDFLAQKNIIQSEQLEEFKKGERLISIEGVNNRLSSGKLKNGMYKFSMISSHHLVFFVLVENDRFTILDISDIKGLEIAVQETLEFCERNKFCSDFTVDYTTRLIEIYNKINKNSQSRKDINCQIGVKEIKDLP